MPDPKAAPAAETPQSKTFTNWKAFAQTKLAPVSITCNAYKPVHAADMSCHTKLLLKGDSLKQHVNHDHGGGFVMQLKANDGKPSTFWQELEDLGLEAHDFRCDNCDKQIRFAPASIIPHLKAHGGKTRRVYPGGNFCLTLSLSKELAENLVTDQDEDND